MRVVRSAGQNVSPSDDGRLFDQIFMDGLFTDASITNLGANNVALSALYGTICGRDFTAEAQNIVVTLPEGDGEYTGYIYVEIDTSSEDVITINSALAPFTPTYEDINTNGAVVQMILAEYTATALAIQSITPVYKIASAGGIGSLAVIETSPARMNHSKDTFLVYDGALYKVTAAIAAGEDLVVGTNISARTVGEELTALKNGLSDLDVKAGTVTLLAGGTSGLLVRQSGHVVSIWGYINYLNLPANTPTNIAQISGVSFPADTVRIRGAVGANAYSVGNDAYIAIGTTGIIQVTPPVAGTTVYFNATYIR